MVGRRTKHPGADRSRGQWAGLGRRSTITAPRSSASRTSSGFRGRDAASEERIPVGGRTDAYGRITSIRFDIEPDSGTNGEDAVVRQGAIRL
jgi:hypothetical protein